MEGLRSFRRCRTRRAADRRRCGRPPDRPSRRSARRRSRAGPSCGRPRPARDGAAEPGPRRATRVARERRAHGGQPLQPAFHQGGEEVRAQGLLRGAARAARDRRRGAGRLQRDALRLCDGASRVGEVGPALAWLSFTGAAPGVSRRAQERQGSRRKGIDQSARRITRGARGSRPISGLVASPRDHHTRVRSSGPAAQASAEGHGARARAGPRVRGRARDERARPLPSGMPSCRASRSQVTDSRSEP